MLAKIFFFQKLVSGKVEIRGYICTSSFIDSKGKFDYHSFMFLTIINDSRDENAFGRQATRAMSLFGCAVSGVVARRKII